MSTTLSTSSDEPLQQVEIITLVAELPALIGCRDGPVSRGTHLTTHSATIDRTLQGTATVKKGIDRKPA